MEGFTTAETTKYYIDVNGRKYCIERIHEGSHGTGYYPCFWDPTAMRYRHYTTAVDRTERARLTSLADGVNFIETMEHTVLAATTATYTSSL